MMVLSVQELSEKLHKSISWIYKNARELGGVKVAGSWIFTQEGLDNALLGAKQTTMESANHLERPKVSTAIPNQARSQGMGNKATSGIAKRRPIGFSPDYIELRSSIPQRRSTAVRGQGV